MSKTTQPVFLVGGARPNFMKIAPLVWQIQKRRLEFRLIHTGQHYDYEMSKVFFDELDMPAPDFFFNAGSGTHAEQTARIMVEFERVCAAEPPGIVLVVGDVNSTLACSITAKKLGIKVAHVEAGLRSGDLTMPEEINRLVTDSISDFLFVTEASGLDNLRREGRGEAQVFLVGNIMIDSLFFGLRKLEARGAARVTDQPYGVLTLHRPSNVDHPDKLADILRAVGEISRTTPVYFPVHPRTARNIRDFHLADLLEKSDIRVQPPLSYLDFLALWKDADLVLTDSGGLQEETTVLGVPCFTIRENTERPITIVEGTNVLVGTSGESLLREYGKFRQGGRKKGRVPDLWDGKAADRIIDLLFARGI